MTIYTRAHVVAFVVAWYATVFAIAAFLAYRHVTWT